LPHGSPLTPAVRCMASSSTHRRWRALLDNSASLWLAYDGPNADIQVPLARATIPLLHLPFAPASRAPHRSLLMSIALVNHFHDLSVPDSGGCQTINIPAAFRDARAAASVALRLSQSVGGASVSPAAAAAAAAAAADLLWGWRSWSRSW